jgi:hypothetical protein
MWLGGLLRHDAMAFVQPAEHSSERLWTPARVVVVMQCCVSLWLRCVRPPRLLHTAHCALLQLPKCQCAIC